VTNLPALTGTFAFPTVSCLFAAGWRALRPDFRADDLWFALIWSSLPCPAIYLVLRAFDRRTALMGAARAYTLALVGGMFSGMAWLLCMWLLFDGWLLNVPYPVVLIWLAGGLAAFTVCSLWRRPASWVWALLVIVSPVLGTYGVLRAASVQPPDILVELVPDATQSDLDQVWAAARAHEGTGAIYRWDGDRAPGIGVSFRPGTSLKRRTEVIARIRGLAKVAQVSDAATTPPGQAKGQWKDLK
jgi:hypothetical protein